MTLFSRSNNRCSRRPFSLRVTVYWLLFQVLLVRGFLEQRYYHSLRRSLPDSSCCRQQKQPLHTNKRHSYFLQDLLNSAASDQASRLFSARSGNEQNSTHSILSNTPSSSSSISSPSSSVRNNSPDTNNKKIRNEDGMDSAERQRLLQDAQALKERAKQLKAEAKAQEAEMKRSRSTLQTKKASESDGMIDHLFKHSEMIAKVRALGGNGAASNTTDTITSTSNNSTVTELTLQQQVQQVVATDVADRLRSERWSPEQVIMVLERLHERQVQVQVSPNILTPSQAAVLDRSPDFQIGDTRNAANTANETEWNLLDFWIASLVDAATILDNEHDNASQTATDESSSNGSVENSQVSAPTNPATGESASEIQKNPRWTGRVAPALKSRRKELIRVQEEELKRKIAANVNAVANAAGTNPPLDSFTNPMTPGSLDIQEYTRQTLGMPSAEQGGKREFNISRVLERVAMVPLWVPSSLLPYLVLSGATLRKEDVAAMKDRVLMGSRFFCTSSDAIPSAAVFRGNIRAPSGVVDTVNLQREHRNHTSLVFEEIQQRLKREGLSERIQLFFMEDPEWRPGQDSRTPKALPVVIAIAKKIEPTAGAMEALTTSIIARRVSVALTVLATASFSVSCFALNPTFFEAVVKHRDLSVLVRCIPLALGVFAVHIIHEAAHFLVARIRGIKIGKPTPLPSPQLASFGCITPLLSFPPNRSALFDVALSGPLSGMIASILMMVGGIYATIGAPELVLQTFPFLPIGLFKSSLLSGTLLSLLAPKTMMLPLAQPVPIHPLFISGFVGLFSNALNLLPIFRLDGGRLCSAIFGQRFLGVASAATLLFMLSLTISGSSGIALSFGLLVILLQRRTEVPPRDDVTQIDDFRLGSWLVSLVAAVLALAPFPGGPGFL